MKRILLLTIILIRVWGAAFAASHLCVLSTTCELQKHFITVTEVPRLGWQMKADRNGEKQSAYEIEVRNAINKKTVYKTGKIGSTDSQFIKLSTDKICAGNTYEWRVRVYDAGNQPSAWSKFQMFCFAPSFTKQATWIAAMRNSDARLPEGRIYQGAVLKNAKAEWDKSDTMSVRSICLRKEFSVGKKIAKAIVHVSGLGQYVMNINGKPVSNDEFAPLWSDYDKTVYYNTFDVTSQLRGGANAIGVMLGNGFYNAQGRGRYTKLQVAFGVPTLWLQLDIAYSDGTHQTVKTDATWKFAPSAVTFNSIYGGESYDARLEQKGWDSPGFDASAWRYAELNEGPKGELVPQQAKPVRIMEHFSPVSSKKLNPSDFTAISKIQKRMPDSSAVVLDMGQNLAGFPQITVRGKRGQKISMWVSEALTPEGAINQRQTDRQHFYEYTLKGDGRETWHPHFSYYGFRYIQIEGAVLKGEKNDRHLPVIDDVKSCFIYNSADEISSFACSDTLFNKVHRLIERAVRSNMQSVFTDCPHREKLGWLEQNHLNGPGLYYNYDLTAYMAKEMRDIADSQQPDGMVPTIAPLYTIFAGKGLDDFGNSPEWGSVLIIIPFQYRDAYGDDSLIRKYYANMVRYIDYLSSRADGGILSFGLGDWYDYGDFKAGFSRNTPVPLVATAQYIMDIQYMIEAARIVGNASDESRFSHLLTNVVKSFNNKFFDTEKGTYGTGSQCSNALPLFLGICGENRDKAMAALLGDIKKHGNRLTTGDVGNRYLFQTLARNGYNDLMYKMMAHDEAPGYGFQLKFGATTLTEQWDPRQGSSWNHFMMGQIDEWFFRTIGGIITQPDGSIVIAPVAAGSLKNADVTTANLYGKIRSCWTLSDDGLFSLECEIPCGSSATIQMPDGSRHSVGCGKFSFSCKK